jgi:fructose transport system ATP-binding protein
MAGAHTKPKLVMQATGLVKRYGQVTALDGADFELRAGEILAVIGDNGAGKSSLIKACRAPPFPTKARSCSTASRCTFKQPDGRAPPASNAATRTWRWPRR